MVSQKLVMFAIMVVIIVVCVGREVMAIPGHFTATWSVHIEGGRSVADQVAAELGFINLGEIIGDHYHFLHTEVKKRSPYPCRHQHQRLNNHERTRWVRQEQIISRRKRDFLPLTKPSTATTNDSKSVTGGAGQPSTTATATAAAKAPSLPQGNNADRPDRELPEPKSTSTERRARLSPPINDDSYYPWNDQRWIEMWYLNRGGGLDMNVVEAWKEGVTGQGIVVTILDDGLEKDHPDLIENYDPQASYDVNNHDEDPQPRYDMIDSNRHGTRCAGEVAATANNTLCAVGIAFGAKVGGVRMLDGDVTDAVEARSLSLNPQHIDIYSASWGPDDDGKTVDGPGELATRAFIEGVTKGRNGKGSIFIWASGNGGNDRDNCNCDGYTNSIWTLSISSATENGDVPWYSEMCSSTLATTYSSGSSSEKQVVTTDLHHACTSSHTGTSASAPLAAGICALALEANKELTWRDMQHIVVRTAKPANLQPTTWRSNGVGRNVSHSFGYGLMDAAAMVRLARVWRTVPVQQRCECSAPQTEKIIPPKSQVVLQLAVNQCFGVNYLEHVQAKISLSASRRGDLEINLISPAGTRVTLLAPRLHDNSRAGFNMWPFMSVHTWGESPYGIWQLEIHNEGKYMGRATLQDWALIFYGTDGPADKNDPSPSNNIHYKINIPQSALVPSITMPSNKNKNNKNPGKGLANVVNISSPFVVNANGNPRKNKNSKNSHRNSQGKNKSSVKPTVTSLRGIFNKTSIYTKQYGNGKGPQRQTDSRLSAMAAKTTSGQTITTTTDRPKQGITAIPNVTKTFKFDKTTKSSKANNLEASTFVHTMKIQKNVSKQPNAEPSGNLKSNNPIYKSGTTGKKSDYRVTDKFIPTTKTYQTTTEDLSTNAPNFRGFIFVDQPPDGHPGVMNPKIPSLFQKYPKIQHIYPAMFPYPKVEVVGNKPSRQHPPLSQFHPELYSGSLMPHDAMDSEMDRDHHESRLASDDKATLTKWDMIFYGTEIPPQGEPDYNAKARPDPLGSGAELTVGEGEAGQHNSIDDAKKADSWRDLLKTRDDGRVEQQPNRPSTNAEHATSGCLNPVNHQSPNCIECLQDYFLYSGQCYKSCPEKTYANHAVTLDVAKPKMVEVAEELSASLKRSTPPVDIRNLNAKNDVINIEELKTMLKSPQNIKANMNEHSINILAQLMHQNSPKFCNDCHYSCLTCSGPNNNQCTSCPGDAELVSMTNGIGYVKESYCYPSRLLPEIENGMILHRFYILFGILIFIILSGLLYFIISRFMMNCGLCHKNRHESNPSSVFGYNRLGDKEKDEMKGVNVQKEIHSAIFEDTDSDSEDNA